MQPEFQPDHNFHCQLACRASHLSLEQPRVEKGNIEENAQPWNDLA